MNRTGKRIGISLGIVVGALIIAGCSTVSTGASEVALEYGGGSFDSANFVKCFGNGYKSTTEGASDVYRYYPTGQRDFSFGDDDGMDMASLTSTTKDSQTVKVTGTIKFTMNLSCNEFKDTTGKTWPGGTAQYFHELIGAKDYNGKFAYNEEGSQSYGDGWRLMLRQYMGFAGNRVVDDNALDYNQAQLIGDRVSKDKWEKDVLDNLPETLKKMTGGVEIFKINSVLLQRPDVAAKIADANSEKEAARIRSEATEIDKQTALNFPGGMPAYQQYLNQQAQNEALKEAARNGKAFPIPYGSPLIAGGGN